MMGEMMGSMGLEMLSEKFKDEDVEMEYQDVFPMDVPKNTRSATKYFTSIGLLVVTGTYVELLTYK